MRMPIALPVLVAAALCWWFLSGARAGSAFELEGCRPFAALADRDGDGREDLAVVRAVDGRVSVELRSSADGSPFYPFDVPGPGYGDALSIAEIDDLDGDGVREVAVAEPARDSDGEPGSLAVFGKGGALVYRRSGADDVRRFGTCLVALDDMDGDGLRDLATGFVRGETSTGGVAVVSGLDGTRFAELRTPNDATVEELVAARDWNGDGRGDLLIVTRKASRVVDAFTGEVLAELPGGYAACGGRDADGDGVADLAIGDWGSVSLVSGASGAVIGTWEKRFDGLDSFASSVAFADLAEDARAELAVGSPELGVDGGRPQDVGELRICAAGREGWLHLEEGRSAHDYLGYGIVALRGADGDRLAVGTRDGLRVYASGAFR